MMTTNNSIKVNPASPPKERPRSRDSRDVAKRISRDRLGRGARGLVSPYATRVVSERTPRPTRPKRLLMRAVGSRKGSPTPARPAPAASKRNLVDRKNGEHHGDDDEGHQHTHAEDDDRL